MIPKTKQTSLTKSKVSYKQIFTLAILMLLLMIFLQRIIRTLFTPFMALFIQEQNHTSFGAAELTGYINGLVGFVTAFSAIMVSRLGDRFEKMKLIRVMLLISLVDVFFLSISDGLMTFTVLYALLFLIIGGVEPLLTSTTSEMTSPEVRGTLFGIQGLVGSLGWMVSPVLGTYVSIAFGMKFIFWFIFIFIALNLTVALTIKKQREKEHNYD